MNQARFIKALMVAHGILLEDLRRLSKGIDQEIDLTGITSKLDNMKSFGSIRLVNMESTDGEVLQPLSDRSLDSAEVLMSGNVIALLPVLHF